MKFVVAWRYATSMHVWACANTRIICIMQVRSYVMQATLHITLSNVYTDIRGARVIQPQAPAPQLPTVAGAVNNHGTTCLLQCLLSECMVSKRAVCLGRLSAEDPISEDASGSAAKMARPCKLRQWAMQTQLGTELALETCLDHVIWRVIPIPRLNRERVENRNVTDVVNYAIAKWAAETYGNFFIAKAPLLRSRWTVRTDICSDLN